MGVHAFSLEGGIVEECDVKVRLTGCVSLGEEEEE